LLLLEFGVKILARCSSNRIDFRWFNGPNCSLVILR
jgi:hypothetical protein